MYKILFITPPSIAGELIIKGFAKGFEALGCSVFVCDVRELSQKIIKEFKPDFIFGYCYAHYAFNSALELIEKAKIAVIHYFADDPFSNFAHSGDLSLIDKLKAKNPLVYLWDKEFVGAFGSNSQYLPLGIDIESYKTENHQLLYDVSFVGRPLTQKRQEILAEVIKKFPDQLSIFCFEKHFGRSVEEMCAKGLLAGKGLDDYKKSYKGFLKTEKELAEVYHSSKINLNITEQGHGSLNYRVFEVMASRGFLLTDSMAELSDFFVQNKDYVSYKDKKEAVMLINKYLNAHALRESIIKSGYEKVKCEHTFANRAQEIIAVLEKL